MEEFYNENGRHKDTKYYYGKTSESKLIEAAINSFYFHRCVNSRTVTTTCVFLHFYHRSVLFTATEVKMV